VREEGVIKEEKEKEERDEKVEDIGFHLKN
jgi:hypothetical protein